MSSTHLTRFVSLFVFCAGLFFVGCGADRAGQRKAASAGMGLALALDYNCATRVVVLRSHDEISAFEIVLHQRTGLAFDRSAATGPPGIGSVYADLPDNVIFWASFRSPIPRSSEVEVGPVLPPDTCGVLAAADFSGAYTAANGACSGAQQQQCIEVTAVGRVCGDANEDGLFDPRDLQLVLQAGKYLSGDPASWRDGDWTGDGLFNPQDVMCVLSGEPSLCGSGCQPIG